MRRRFIPGKSRRDSFTLIELMVAVAVLAIIVLFTGQIVVMTSQTTTTDARRIDALESAREALDRSSLDWAARLSRNDVDVAFTANPGGDNNDRITFFNQVTSPVAGATVVRPVSEVDYLMGTNSATGLPQLIRGGIGFGWGTGNAPLLSYPVTNISSLLPADPASSSSYQPLSQGVFRFEYALLTAATPSVPAVLVTTNVTSASSLTNITALVVGVAVLDDVSMKNITPAQLKALSDALPYTTANPDPVQAWQTALTNHFAPAGVPVNIAKAVRVYERYFYVNTAP